MSAMEQMPVHHKCWTDLRSAETIRLGAERFDRETFLAVHTNKPIQVATAKAGDDDANRFSTMMPRALLDAFLGEPGPVVGAVVVGDSGSGKSHLVRWLDMHLQASPGRVVVTVPKSGTSLRGVVELLLRELPTGVAEKYVAALPAVANPDMSPVDRRRSLSLNMSLELHQMQPAPDDRIESWLIPDRLPLLLDEQNELQTTTDDDRSHRRSDGADRGGG